MQLNDDELVHLGHNECIASNPLYEALDNSKIMPAHDKPTKHVNQRHRRYFSLVRDAGNKDIESTDLMDSVIVESNEEKVIRTCNRKIFNDCDVPF